MNIALHAQSARLLLRDACGDAHARLDGRLSGLDLTRRDVYAATLSRMSGPLTALEAGLAREGARMLRDWGARMRASALHDDLRQLGGTFVDRERAVEALD